MNLNPIGEVLKKRYNSQSRFIELSEEIKEEGLNNPILHSESSNSGLNMIREVRIDHFNNMRIMEQVMTDISLNFKSVNSNFLRYYLNNFEEIKDNIKVWEATKNIKIEEGWLACIDKKSLLLALLVVSTSIIIYIKHNQNIEMILEETARRVRLESEEKFNVLINTIGSQKEGISILEGRLKEIENMAEPHVNEVIINPNFSTIIIALVVIVRIITKIIK